MAGPCDWPVSYEECGACEPLEFFTDTAQATFEEMAVDFLWNWTGRSFGTCPVVLRPCRTNCADYPTFWGRGPGPNGTPFQPVLISGQWYNLVCPMCGDVCSCGATIESLALPGPVVSVDQVLVDGLALDPSAYRLDNAKYLIRVDGLRWPTCQNMALPTTDADTFEISYTQGVAVPKGGQIAAGMLALELMKAACNDNTCRLPQRVQSITRQGVTVAVLDSFEDVGQGRTGIWLIDSWVASVTKPRTGATVRSVDVPRHVRTTQQNATLFGATGNAGGVGGQ